MSLSFIINHAEKAFNRLLEQYKGKPKIEGITYKLALKAQALEDVLKQVYEGRFLNNAEGAQLDGIGRIVGLPRVAGLNDAEYLLRIRIQIIQNLNNATPEEIITAAKFFLQASVTDYNEIYPASVSIFSTTFFPPSQRKFILGQLKRLLPAGVSLESIGSFDPDSPFIFNSGNGFGDVNDPSIGGLLADGFFEPIPGIKLQLEQGGGYLITEDGNTLVLEQGSE